MRKNKQREIRLDEASLHTSLGKALCQPGDCAAASETQDELSSFVESYISHRNELLRRLNLEIEAAEKRLLELRRTREELFPDGKIQTLSEPERVERKPKKSAKANKVPQTSPEIHVVTESTRNESNSRPEIHSTGDLSVTKITNITLPGQTLPVPSVERTQTLGSGRVDVVVGSVAPFADHFELRRDCPPLAFHPGFSPGHMQTLLESPVTHVVSDKALRSRHSQADAMIQHRHDSVARPSVEPGCVVPKFRIGRVYSRRYRLDRFLVTRTRRSRRPTRCSRVGLSPAPGSWRSKFAKKQLMFRFAPFISTASVADDVPRLRKAAHVLRSIPLSKARRDRFDSQRTYNPRSERSNLNSLPLSLRHDGVGLLFKRARTAA